MAAIGIGWTSPECPRPAAHLMLIVLLCAFACSIVMMVAGLKMKRLQAYRLAIATSILAMIVSPTNLIGLPIGIWALVVLTQRDVRDAFSQRSRSKSDRQPPPTENKEAKGASTPAAVERGQQQYGIG